MTKESTVVNINRESEKNTLLLRDGIEPVISGY